MSLIQLFHPIGEYSQIALLQFYFQIIPIGNLLEVGVEPMLAELWACIKLSSKSSIDYNNVRNLKLSVIIQNIIDANYLRELLETKPHELKLSDWRNIAYHSSYQMIDDSTIRCTYGENNSQSIALKIDELKQYTIQIARTANIMAIARMIFMFDNLEMIHNLKL